MDEGILFIFVLIWWAIFWDMKSFPAFRLCMNFFGGQKLVWYFFARFFAPWFRFEDIFLSCVLQCRILCVIAQHPSPSKKTYRLALLTLMSFTYSYPVDIFVTEIMFYNIFFSLFPFSSVECPAGTYYNKDSQTCENCQEGTYQNSTGQLSCEPCPVGTWTVGGHARNFTECFGQ